MRVPLIPARPHVQLSERMRRQSQALRLSSSEIRRLAISERDSAEEQAARHLLQVSLETGPHIALQGLPCEELMLGCASVTPCRVAGRIVCRRRSPKPGRRLV